MRLALSSGSTSAKKSSKPNSSATARVTVSESPVIATMFGVLSNTAFTLVLLIRVVLIVAAFPGVAVSDQRSPSHLDDSVISNIPRTPRSASSAFVYRVVIPPIDSGFRSCGGESGWKGERKRPSVQQPARTRPLAFRCQHRDQVARFIIVLLIGSGTMINDDKATGRRLRCQQTG